MRLGDIANGHTQLTRIAWLPHSSARGAAEQSDRSLGAGIGGPPRQPLDARARAEVDDAPAAGLQLPVDRLHRDEAADHVDVQLAMQGFDRQLGERRGTVVGVGQVHEPVEATELPERGRDHGVDAGAVDDVAAEPDGPRAARASRRRRPRARRVVEVADHHVRALRRGGEHAAASDPLRAADDQDRLAVEPAHRDQWLKLGAGGVREAET